MPVTVEVPDVGSIEFPDSMPPDQIRLAVAKLHAEKGVNPDVGTLDEEPRTPAIGEDPRYAPDAAFNEAQTAKIAGAIPKGYATMATEAYGLPNAGSILKALGNPYVAAGINGARELVQSGDPVKAGWEAAKGYGGAKVLGFFGKGGLLARLGAAARVAPEVAAAEQAAPIVAEVAEAAPAAYRGIPSLMRIAGPAAEEAAAATEAARATKQAGNLANILRPTAGAAAPAVQEAVPVAAKAVEAAAAAAPTVTAAAKGAAPAKTVVQFAKEIAKENPKVGEKIWILLDDAGMPLKRLTPDQAAAAARKGLQTTWVKNLW